MRAGPWRPLWVLLALSLAMRLLTAWLLGQPGYTDAYYYAVGARQVCDGKGFQEPFIWNYLAPPEEIPHPGYRYWMPLTAMLGCLGMTLLGDSFRAMQAPFVFLAALLPVVAYAVAWDLSGRSPAFSRHRARHAMLAGLLAVFPGFYAHVLVLPDTFAPFALAGSLCLWAAGRGLQDRKILWFGLAGVAAGFGHLARADGILLAGIVLVMAVLAAADRRVHDEPGLDRRTRQTRGVAKDTVTGAALTAGGYLLVMGPWFLRNWQVFGVPLAGGGIQTLFLTSYDDMFAYNQALTLQSYLDWGWGEILRSKGEALLLNLLRLWVENLMIVLLPLTAVGLWRLRRVRLLWPFTLYLPLLFLSMTIAFTFPGMRGGLFHSAGALLPFLFAAAGPGLETLLGWAARRLRGWQPNKAWPVFSAGLSGVAVLVTLFALWRAGVLSGDWNERGQEYVEIGAWLASREASEAVVMVGDAPAFTWHTGHQAIAIPNEPLDTIAEVADRYGARYLVLDSTRTRTTDALYSGETVDPRFALRLSTGTPERLTLLLEILP
jgi:hypothetical protein